MKIPQYQIESERRHESGFWVSPAHYLSDPVALGACGYTALLLLRNALGNCRGKILDVGGGDGGFLLRLTGSRNFKPCLLDIIYQPLKKFPGPAVQGDSINLPFHDETFDLVLTSDHLEHLNVEDVRRSLNEMRRVLKRGGKALIHTSVFGLYLRRCGARYGEDGRLDRYDLEDGHLCRPTIREWMRMVREAGLKVNKIYFYKHLFQPVMRGIKNLIFKKTLREESGTPAGQDLKTNPLIKIMGYFIVLISLLDIFMFSKVPGGAVVMGVKEDRLSDL